MCDKDALQARHVAIKPKKTMVFGKANYKGFLKEFKPISTIAWNKMRIESLNISNFIKQLNPTL